MRDTIELEKIIPDPLYIPMPPFPHFLEISSVWGPYFPVLSFFLSLLHMAFLQPMETPLVQETNWLFLQLSKMASQTFFDGCQSRFHVGRWTPDQFCHVNIAPQKLIHRQLASSLELFLQATVFAVVYNTKWATLREKRQRKELKKHGSRDGIRSTWWDVIRAEERKN